MNNAHNSVVFDFGKRFKLAYHFMFGSEFRQPASSYAARFIEDVFLIQGIDDRNLTLSAAPITIKKIYDKVLASDLSKRFFDLRTSERPYPNLTIDEISDMIKLQSDKSYDLAKATHKHLVLKAIFRKAIFLYCHSKRSLRLTIALRACGPQSDLVKDELQKADNLDQESLMNLDRVFRMYEAYQLAPEDTLKDIISPFEVSLRLAELTAKSYETENSPVQLSDGSVIQSDDQREIPETDESEPDHETFVLNDSQMTNDFKTISEAFVKAKIEDVEDIVVIRPWTCRLSKNGCFAPLKIFMQLVRYSSGTSAH